MTIQSNAIIGRLVQHLIDAGFRVELSDQDGGGLYCYAWPEGNARPGKFNHWVRLQPANDAPTDVITDYTTNLETVLKPVLTYAETLEALFVEE